jgi:N-acetylglutamate synthase-like GNAT family acetyltransferase
MAVAVADPGDLTNIQELLRSNGLPTEDLDAAGVRTHWVWREAGRVVGTAGLDVVGSFAVFRSLATEEAFRGQGIATALCDAAEEEAHRRGVTALYLLTETAPALFERRGYRTIDRASVPESIACHRQFASGCCQCAVAMVKSLESL